MHIAYLRGGKSPVYKPPRPISKSASSPRAATVDGVSPLPPALRASGYPPQRATISQLAIASLSARNARMGTIPWRRSRPRATKRLSDRQNAHVPLDLRGDWALREICGKPCDCGELPLRGERKPLATRRAERERSPQPPFAEASVCGADRRMAGARGETSPLCLLTALAPVSASSRR